MGLRDYYSELAVTSVAAQIDGHLIEEQGAGQTILQAEESGTRQGVEQIAEVMDIAMSAKANDRWALSCISILKIQPLVEALDDDASTFVTVAEANDFTASRPPDWRWETFLSLIKTSRVTSRLVFYTGWHIGPPASITFMHASWAKLMI